MKKLVFLILLTLPCVSISQVTNDSLKIAPKQVVNIYRGLKSVSVLNQRLNDCIITTKKLDSVIQTRNKELIKFVSLNQNFNKTIEDLQEQKLKQSIEIERLENKKIPWYKHPILYFILGFSAGIYIAK